MISIGGTVLALNDPAVLLVSGGVALAGLVVLLLIASLRAANRSARLVVPLAQQMGQLGMRVQALGDGQERLAGGLHHVSEAQANSQTAMLNLMEQRLAAVQLQMNENLHGSARRTAQSLGDLQQRLQSIDRAQENITKLSGMSCRFRIS